MVVVAKGSGEVDVCLCKEGLASGLVSCRSSTEWSTFEQHKLNALEINLKKFPIVLLSTKFEICTVINLGVKTKR